MSSEVKVAKGTILKMGHSTTMRSFMKYGIEYMLHSTRTKHTISSRIVIPDHRLLPFDPASVDPYHCHLQISRFHC